MVQLSAADDVSLLTKSRLPIGLQIVGRHYQDERILVVAGKYETLHPFHSPPLSAAAKKW